jgi:cold shock CspA family protein
MRQQGRLSEWNDARGFGFVQPNGGGDRCFVHIRAFAARDRRLP